MSVNTFFSKTNNQRAPQPKIQWPRKFHIFSTNEDVVIEYEGPVPPALITQLGGRAKARDTFPWL